MLSLFLINKGVHHVLWDEFVLRMKKNVCKPCPRRIAHSVNTENTVNVHLWPGVLRPG